MDKLNLPADCACTYTHHDTGIHEFRMTEASRRGWDGFLDSISAIIKAQTERRTLLVLLDSTVGTPPLRYITNRAPSWTAEHPDRPAMHIAILYDDSVLFTFADMVMKGLRRRRDSSARFFRSDQRDQAIAWLLESGE
jgi:hypothetical protein